MDKEDNFKKTRPWRRNLFEKTDLPDNFTPPDCFLAAIQRNKNLERHSLEKCVQAACQVSLQLNALVLFILCYLFLDRRLLGPEILAPLAASLTSLGYLTVQLPGLSLQSVIRDLKHVLVFGGFGLGLSPILHKLTDTVSTDTVHTTSAFMLLLHLLFHNYDPGSASKGGLSLNAALFAAVCLASRLGNSWDSLVLLMISVIAFVLFPLVRIKLESRVLVLGSTLLGSAVSSGLMAAFFSGLSALGTLGILFFVTLVAPGLFVRWQNHKDTIHGPWDEAVPKIK